MAECLSRFTLVQWRVGDLSSEENESIERHLEQCSACRAVVAEIQENRSAYESRSEEHLTGLLAQLETEDASVPRRRLPWKAIVPAACAIAAAAAIILMISFEDSSTEDPSTSSTQVDDSTAIQFKGVMSFDIVAKRREHQFFVKRGAELKPNDAVRFVVTTASEGYLSIFSVIPSGQVSPFYPESDPARDSSPMWIEGAGRHELPGSVILDDAIGDEYFVIVFSPEPFDREKIHDMAEKASRTGPFESFSDTDADQRFNIGVIGIKKVP
ncbi:MAG: DUF4384 domain-containing protein [Deltaproteobacteria bacterium]|nr:DUF4384 domain-containing protein [Deltaproteobacteria bacterium]